MLVCPLHHRPYPCPCTRTVIDQHDLKEPAAIGLWECADGHRTVGTPTASNQGGRASSAAVCPCGLPAVRVAAAVIPSRL